MAYKVAEDPRVRIPTAVGYDGYVISYTAEPVEIPDQALVDEWLPKNVAMPSIMPDGFNMMKFMGEVMTTMGMIGDPQNAWKTHHESILGAEVVIKETMDSFEKTFGLQQKCHLLQSSNGLLMTTIKVGKHENWQMLGE